MGSRSPIVLERCRTGSDVATGRFRIGRRSATVRFEGVAPDPRSAADAFAAIGQLIGMENDRRVVSLPRLGRTFIDRMDSYQAVHLSLFPHHHASPLSHASTPL